MSSQSPSLSAKALETQIRGILRKSEIGNLGIDLRNLITDMQQELADAKAYAGHYELSEMRDEQLDNAKTAKKFLRKVQAKVLKASEHNIFSAVDVAHLSAQIDQIQKELK